MTNDTFLRFRPAPPPGQTPASAILRCRRQTATLPVREEIAVLSIFYRLMKCEGGATAFEYVLIAALVGLAAFQITEKMAGTPATTMM
jgi:hypothetical protein